MTDLPFAMPLPTATPARVLALGAYLKNRACLVEGSRVTWSTLHGDLGEPRACAALSKSVEQLLAGADGPIRAVAHDLHPDFPSTLQAEALAAQMDIPAIGVQHHHAHIAAVLAERTASRPVIGIALDGAGLGSDGSSWGGELLRVEGGISSHRWRRLGHLHPLPLPGGDVAAREPWRMAASLLHVIGRGDEIEARFSPSVGRPAARTLRTMLERSLNCSLTSSAGRWFDAAAGALGLCVQQSHEAEAAMALEREASRWLRDHPGFGAPSSGLDLRPVVASLFDVDPGDSCAVGRGAALFHLALANSLAQAAIAAALDADTRHVALSGGCFVNQVLTEQITARLRKAGLSVLVPQRISCGDTGLALGQAWIAACQLADRDPRRALEIMELEI